MTIPNVYTPSKGAAKYVKQKTLELEEGMDKSTVIVGDVNTLLSTIDRTTE